MGKSVTAGWGLTSDGKAIIEMAQAAGNRPVTDASKDPMKANTHGVGELIRSALDRGARDLTIGLGGSATVDGGAGALHALGTRFLDRAGRELEPIPEKLTNLHRVNTCSLDKRLLASRVTVLADVDTPARSAARVYGPQKGLRQGDQPRVNLLLRKLAALGGDREAVNMPMGGAAGGFAMSLFLFAGGRLVQGSTWLADAVHLPEAVRAADYVMTGEGRFDQSSTAGKAPMTVLRIADQNKVPAVVFAGTVARAVTLSPGHTLIQLIKDGESIQAAIADAPERLKRAVTLFLENSMR
jgi:glycerate kinase